MIEFLLTFLVFALVIAGMAIGVMHGRKPISGSCGGLANVGVDGACEICGGDPSRCESPEDAPAPKKGSFYDAA